MNASVAEDDTVAPPGDPHTPTLSNRCCWRPQQPVRSINCAPTVQKYVLTRGYRLGQIGVHTGCPYEPNYPTDVHPLLHWSSFFKAIHYGLIESYIVNSGNKHEEQKGHHSGYNIYLLPSAIAL